MTAKPTYEELEQINQQLMKKNEQLQAAMAELTIQVKQIYNIFSNLNDVIFSVNPIGYKLLFITPVCEKIYGKTQDDFYENPLLWKEFIHPEDVELATQKNDDLMDGKNILVEYRIKRPDGEIKWIRVKVHPTTDEQGTVVRFDGSISDITDSRLAEQELKDTEKRFQNIIDSSPMGIHMYKLEPDGRLVFTGANPAADRILGADNKQFIGKTIEEAFPPLADTEVPERYKRACEKGETWKTEQITYEDEQIRGIYELYAFQTSRNMMAVMFLDITARKLAENALTESEKRFSSIIEDTEAGYFLINQHGRFVTVNNAWLKIHKFSSLSDIIDQHFSLTQVDIDLEQAQQNVEKLLNGAKIPTGEFTRRNQDGSIGYHSFSAHPVMKDNKVIGLEGFIIDQTEQRKMRDALLKSKKLESIGILAGGIAHDYNNLLSVIMGNLSLAKHDIPTESGVSRFLTQALSATERARELTKQLLVFSKGGDPVKRTGSVKSVIENVSYAAVNNTNCKCDYCIQHDLWVSQFDEGQMKYAFNSIIVNAIDAMPDGGVISINAENHMISEESTEDDLTLKPGRYIKISIHDQGCGISEENLPLVFDPYFSTKERGDQKGMGLGLTSAYAILRKHEGYIRISSKTGRGTTVTIYLPAVEEKSTTGKKAPCKPVPTKKRILVMDDEEQIRELLETMLDRLGYEVELASNGQEVIQQFENAMNSGRQFDILILDLTVKGGLGGKDTLENLIKKYPDIKAIVISGFSNDPVMSDCGAYGFVGAIKKPFTMDQLNEAIETFIKNDD